MPSLSTTYLLPAIFLNPCFLLHLINTVVSHYGPPPTASVSPHPFMESIGPVPGSVLYMDMHADDQLCWGYTFLMVLVQLFAFGRVQDNRSQRRERRERVRKERKERMERMERLERLGEQKSILVGAYDGSADTKVVGNGFANGGGMGNGKGVEMNGGVLGTDEETSMTETSEEEMFV
jgi:hypothetical protein